MSCFYGVGMQDSQGERTGFQFLHDFINLQAQKTQTGTSKPFLRMIFCVMFILKFLR